MATGEVLEDITAARDLRDRAGGVRHRQVSRAPARRPRARHPPRARHLQRRGIRPPMARRSSRRQASPARDTRPAWVKVEPSGAVNASIGLMASGQGYETTFAQVVADALGVAPEDVRLTIGNTDTAPYGMGSRGARGGTAGGRRADAGRPGVAREGAGHRRRAAGPQQQRRAAPGAGAASSGGSAERGPGPGSASPISPRSPISIRCGCRPAWSRVWRHTRPTTPRR